MKRFLSLALTSKGLSYFTRKHVCSQMLALGILSAEEEKGFEADSLGEISTLCKRSGYTPVVTLVPDDDAWDVFDGKSGLSVDRNELR